MGETRAQRVRRGTEATVETGRLELGEVTEDFVWDMSTFAGWPEQPLYHGREAAEKFIADWVTAFDDWDLEIDEMIEAGDDVVMLARQSGAAHGSGARVQMSLAQVWSFREDRLARVRVYAGHDEALAATGLKPRRA